MHAGLAACFVFFQIIAIVAGAPTHERAADAENVNSSHHPAGDKPSCHSETPEFYDQRQNGTENYRINLNGVVVLVAPADTVLQAAQLTGLQLENELGMGTMGSGSQQGLKPKPRPPTPGEKVQMSATSEHKHATQTAHQKEDKESIRPEIDGSSDSFHHR